ncbi:MAG TPA: hypothetical protein VF012_06710 [Nocardioidaceae bacterium]
MSDYDTERTSLPQLRPLCGDRPEVPRRRRRRASAPDTTRTIPATVWKATLLPAPVSGRAPLVVCGAVVGPALVAAALLAGTQVGRPVVVGLVEAVVGLTEALVGLLRPGLVELGLVDVGLVDVGLVDVWLVGPVGLVEALDGMHVGVVVLDDSDSGATSWFEASVPAVLDESVASARSVTCPLVSSVVASLDDSLAEPASRPADGSVFSSDTGQAPIASPCRR